MTDLPYIPRRAARKGNKGDETRLLSDWDTEPSYVLLGDPGSGKTRALRAEAERANTTVIQARELVHFDPASSGSAPFFVDSLDEASAWNTSHDAVYPVLTRLHRSGRRFRITCREMDWRAAQLASFKLFGESGPSVLHLCPLDETEIADSIAHRGERDPLGFLAEARRRGMSSLLGNPLLLDLLWRKVARDGQWPRTRSDLFEATCSDLAQEHSPEHRDATSRAGLPNNCRQVAGTLFSTLLLSSRHALSEHESGTDIVTIDEIRDTRPHREYQAALGSKLFSSDGRTFVPRHRTIAEHEAGRELARLVRDKGLPLERVLALATVTSRPSLGSHTTDPANLPAEECREPHPDMRGLLAWFAAHSIGGPRHRLLIVDPLGFVVNADPGVLTGEEKATLLRRLEHLLHKDPWLLHGQWHSHPYGPLATRDQITFFTEKLGASATTLPEGAFRRCLLMALAHAPEGHEMRELVGRLQQLCEEPGLAAFAFDAWHRHADAPTRDRQLRLWVAKLRDGLIPDDDQTLLGKVLDCAFPQLIGVEVLDFLPAPGEFSVTLATNFWSMRFVPTIPVIMLKPMLEAWSQRFPDGADSIETSYRTCHLAHQLVERAFNLFGEEESPEALCGWLDLIVDSTGRSTGSEDWRKRINAWLEAHPDQMKAIAAAGHRQASDGFYWRSELRLDGARRPRDWIRWIMQVTASSIDARFTRWAIGRVGESALKGDAWLDVPTARDVEDWVRQLGEQHPDANGWLQETWTTPVDGWQHDQYRREEGHRTRQREDRDARHRHFRAIIESSGTKPLPAKLLHDAAMAHENQLLGIDGADPRDRIADLLGGTVADADKVLEAIDSSLHRPDIPSFDDVLASANQDKVHYVQGALRLAAKRSHSRDKESWRAWDEALITTLIASWLAWGIGDPPAWVDALVKERVDLVARVYIRYAADRLRRTRPGTVSGLAHLATHDSWRALAPLVLPHLLHSLPTRLSLETRGLLNRELLPALAVLPADEAKNIITERLSKRGLDSSQRVCWLVALLRFDPLAVQELRRVVKGRNTAKMTETLRAALDEQHISGQSYGYLTPMSARCLIETLAPTTEPSRRGTQSSASVDNQKRRELVQCLIENLAVDQSLDAEKDLVALHDAPTLRPWQTHLSFVLSARRRRPALAAPTKPAHVARTLMNGPPASPDDLVALLLDHLRSITLEFRGQEEFELRYFYRDDEVTPRPENDCRDLILGKVRTRLAHQQVSISSEARAPDDKRKDLSIQAWRQDRQFNVPVEVKKDSHDEVWTAWRTQLPLYMNSQCQGRAIYLVLWFGYRTCRKGLKHSPKSADEAQRLLNSLVTTYEPSRGVTVFVMDLTIPHDAKRTRIRRSNRRP